MILNNIALFLINIIHLLVIIFILLAPFSNSTFILLVHVIIVPFIMLHWLLNNDTCAVTEMEKFVRSQMEGGRPVANGECFSYKIIGPVYNFISENADYSKYTWLLTLGLWGISLYKVNDKYKSGSIHKLFKLA